MSASKNYSALIVTGARQVGKTAALKRLLGEGRGYVPLDDRENRRLAQSGPELFIAINPAPLIISEIQHAPELFPYIKMSIDNGAPAGSYLMSGSHEYALMRLAGESLAGRAAILRMSGLSQHEIYGRGECLPLSFELGALQKRAATGKPCDLAGQYERIWNGSMPECISGGNVPPSYIGSYIDWGLKEAVALKEEYLFSDFVRAPASRIGQILKLREIAEDVGVSSDTTKIWLGAWRRWHPARQRSHYLHKERFFCN